MKNGSTMIFTEMLLEAEPKPSVNPYKSTTNLKN